MSKICSRSSIFFPSQSLVPFGVLSSILGAILSVLFDLSDPNLETEVVKLLGVQKVAWSSTSGVADVRSVCGVLGGRGRTDLIALARRMVRIHVSIEDQGQNMTKLLRQDEKRWTQSGGVVLEGQPWKVGW